MREEIHTMAGEYGAIDTEDGPVVDEERTGDVLRWEGRRASIDPDARLMGDGV